MTADEDQFIFLAQVLGIVLGEAFTGRGSVHDPLGLCLDGGQRLAQRIGLDHHAGSPTVGNIVTTLMLVGGKTAEVNDFILHQAALHSPPHD
ncbi:hypothetical protein SDC9_165805 [bioreactor metagenome]|uniref:Uncharacterized protein n=1 Tax=bioreactor metagenome TaxID=1076179 RepID=A0A645FVF6_9ZZZZ